MKVPANWPYQFIRPVRLEILMRLTKTLQEITIANGYLFDMQESVFRGRNVFGPKDPSPMLAILETPIQPEAIPSPPDSPLRTGPYELTIQGFVTDDPENPTDPAHFLAAEVIRRLAVEKERNANYELFDMGDDVTNISIGEPVIRPPDELSATSYCYIPIRLTLAEDLRHPYGPKK